MAYSPQTQVKINYLDSIIDKHPDWGASRLQKAIKAEFGSELRKQYLLKEAAGFRASQKIASPRIKYNEERHFESILRKGGYTDYEKNQFREQIDRYSPDGRNNFIYSPTFEQTAKQHAKWLKELIADAKKITGNKETAKKKVYDQLEKLQENAQYDPFQMLKEQEQSETVMSGIIKIRKLKRDYTEARRAIAIKKRDLVKDKVLEETRRR